MYGRRVLEAVLAAGCSDSGATVHFVDERFDEGSILAQWPVPVLSGDTAADLAARVLAVEHRLYPLAAGHLCRAVAAGREPEPFTRGPQSFALAGDQTYSTIETLFQEAFPEP
jgi:folate-dependent phosphoribosylglycinamide formyltransferase PurN